MNGEERQEKMKGKVTAVHGHVVEIEFKEGPPALNETIVIKRHDGRDLLLEVHKHQNHSNEIKIELLSAYPHPCILEILGGSRLV